MSPPQPAYDPSSPLKGASECPHCEAFSVVVAHTEHRFVCGVCGAPRVKLATSGYQLSGRERAPLERAQAARRQRFFWRVAGAFGGLVGAAGLAITSLLALIFSAGWSTGLGVAAALPFLLLAGVAFAKSRARGGEIRAALDQAWAAAARDVVLAAPHGVTAQHIREALGLSEEVTSQVLAQLEVDNVVRSRVSEQGALVYSAVGGPQLRIDPGAASGAPTQIADTGKLEDRFAALDEALATEQQAAGAATNEKKVGHE